MSTRAPGPLTVTSRLEAPGYRHDLDGLRAIAVLLVVIYHVWLGRVSGGVDAFLVLSAFLLTGSLIRRLESTGRVRVVHQWVRSFTRILPLAAMVIIATGVIGYLVLPASALAGLWRHALASILYLENWLLAAEAVDYYADSALASPLRHFWSLSVQGQVFLLWPLLFALIAGIAWAFRGRISARRIAITVFGSIFLVSLAYSIILTDAAQQFAYFSTGARLWEFAAGSLLALVIHRLRLPVVVRAVIGWIGVVALIACGLVLDVQGGFPGFLALWPVLCVAAIVVSGAAEDRSFGPARFLEHRSVLSVGRSAYALYLIHWPILVFLLVARDGEPLNFVEGLIVILGSVGLAMILTRWLDAPLKRSPWVARTDWRGIGIIALSVLLVAGPVLGLQAQAARQAAEDLRAIEEAPAQVLTVRNPGAAVLLDDWNQQEDVEAPRRPLASEVPTQWGGLQHDCADGGLMPLPDSVKICFDNAVAEADAERTLVVIGNSHAQQMLPPIEQAADERGWRVISFLYAACAFGLRPVDESRGIFYSQECRDWNEDVLDLISEISPDAVVTIGTESIPADADSADDAGGSEHVLAGVAASITRLDEIGVPLILIRDNPRFTFNNYRCAELASDLSEECLTTVGQALAPTNPADRLTSANVANIDLTHYFCPSGVCPAVIGNVNVYIDDNHLSIVYTRTLSPVLGTAIEDALTGFDQQQRRR